MTEPLLNAEQTGALLNVPASWVLQEARADRIPHVRLAGTSGSMPGPWRPGGGAGPEARSGGVLGAYPGAYPPSNPAEMGRGGIRLLSRAFEARPNRAEPPGCNS